MWFKHTPNMMRICIYKREFYSVDLQIKDNHPFLHFEISKLTPKVYRSMVADLDSLQFLLGSLGYPYVFGAIMPRDEKLERLYNRLGLDLIVEEENMAVFVLKTEECEADPTIRLYEEK